jgi:hypothetical protein
MVLGDSTLKPLTPSVNAPLVQNSVGQFLIFSRTTQAGSRVFLINLIFNFFLMEDPLVLRRSFGFGSSEYFQKLKHVGSRAASNFLDQQF